MESGDKKQGALECWAIVELMGHQRLAGYLCEKALGAAALLRLDVPEVEYTHHAYEIDGTKSEQRKIAAFTKFISPNAIYAITPCTEETARAAASSFVARPVQEFSVTVRKALPYDDEDRDEDDIERL